MADSPLIPDPSEGASPSTAPRGSSNPTVDYRVELPYPEELQAMLPEGSYIVESFIGQGGMAAVYQGLQMPLKRPVAIKILARGAGADYGFEERFKREAYAMAALTHPNIVHVYDCGDAGDYFLFISMELVDGGDMSEAIKAGQVTPQVALQLILHICDGLQAAHERGIGHRDIKPANIFLTKDGRAKVADFGLAKKFDARETMVTRSGLGLGTPDYAAPEQFEQNADIDHRADIYSLGVMFYQMLTGVVPRGAWKPPSARAGTDRRLDAVVLRAMESDRADRYQTVADMKADIIRATQPQQSGAVPTARVTSGPLAAVKPVTRSVPTRPTQPTGQRTSPTTTGPPRHSAPVPVRSQPVPAYRAATVSTPVPAAPSKSRGVPMAVLAAGVGALLLAAGAWAFLKSGSSTGRPGTVELLGPGFAEGDGVRGIWTRTSAGLQCRPTNPGPGLTDDDRMPVFELHYSPPEEYDFELEFTRSSGGVCHLLHAAGASFTHQFGNYPDDGTPSRTGLSRLDGQSLDRSSGEAVVKAVPPARDGTRHRAVVEVRRGSVRSTLNGVEVIRWSGDLSRLSLPPGLRMTSSGVLGFAVWAGEATFHSATVREFSGPGQMVTPTSLASTEKDTVSPAAMRSVVEFVLSLNGFVLVQTGGIKTKVTRIEDLPATFDRLVEVDVPANRPPLTLPPGMLTTIASFEGMNRLALRKLTLSSEDIRALLSSMPKLAYINLSDNKAADSIADSMSRMTGLEAVELGYCKQITGRGFEKMADLPRLFNFAANDTLVDDAGASSIGGLHRLKTLNLNSTRVTDLGLGGLSSLKDLEVFCIRNTEVTIPGLTALRAATKLRRIELSIGKGIKDIREFTGLSSTFPSLKELVIDVGGPKEKEFAPQLARLEELAAMKSLGRLELRGSPTVSASVIAGLDRWPALGHLEISYTFRDEDAAMLKKLRSLRVLKLSNADLTESGALALAAVGSLKETNRGAFTESALKTFREYRPDVRIVE